MGAPLRLQASTSVRGSSKAEASAKLNRFDVQGRPEVNETRLLPEAPARVARPGTSRDKKFGRD